MNMDAIRIVKRFEQLNQRRAQVSLTLEHVEKERREAEDNTDWLDRAAYESRIALLDRLCDWYTQEGAEIDEALDRIAGNQYGLCVACHEAIDSQRLESFPQVAFCAACQEAREGLERV
jgi:RNA polymerase-binding transcription factor DksA